MYRGITTPSLLHNTSNNWTHRINWVSKHTLFRFSTLLRISTRRKKIAWQENSNRTESLTSVVQSRVTSSNHFARVPSGAVYSFSIWLFKISENWYTEPILGRFIFSMDFIFPFNFISLEEKFSLHWAYEKRCGKGNIQNVIDFLVVAPMKKKP